MEVYMTGSGPLLPPPSGKVDLRTVDSREKAQALCGQGVLEKMYLLPAEAGGDDRSANTVYAPPHVVRRKAAIDQEVIRPLATMGRVRQYKATPEYQGKSVVPTAITITASDPETYRFVINVWGDAIERESREWNDVYASREAAYAEHFGPIVGDVQKLMNLMGVWPGGCLVQIESPKHGLWVTSSFGLTNADMPTRVRPENVAVGQAPDGNPEYQSRLVGRPPRAVPAGRAGYGYEILLLTRRKEFWPLMFLNWAVQSEILGDVDLLGRVYEFGALTVESIEIGEGRTADFLIAPLRQFAPSAVPLPNGSMELLVATVVSRAEMEFGVQQGGRALLELVLSKEQGQVSEVVP
jgi:hypothetical protein